MSAIMYQAGARVAFIDENTQTVIEDDIWKVRQGYYHMPGDQHLRDEDIVGSVVDGRKIANPLFTRERAQIAARASADIQKSADWSSAGEGN